MKETSFFSYQSTVNGELTDLSDPAVKSVEEEHNHDHDLATPLHQHTVEKIAKDQPRRVKLATHKVVSVLFSPLLKIMERL